MKCKALRIPLGAVGYHIVANYIPMAPDGESGHPAYVVSERAIENIPPSLDFLSLVIIWKVGYGQHHMVILMAMKEKSIYKWYLHEIYWQLKPDSVVGELILSEPTDIIFPVCPHVYR